jgi:hypothetical protein
MQLSELGSMTSGASAHQTTSSSSSSSCHATCAAFSPVGFQLAVGYREGCVRLYDTASAVLLQVSLAHTSHNS